MRRKKLHPQGITTRLPIRTRNKHSIQSFGLPNFQNFQVSKCCCRTTLCCRCSFNRRLLPNYKLSCCPREFLKTRIHYQIAIKKPHETALHSLKGTSPPLLYNQTQHLHETPKRSRRLPWGREYSRQPVSAISYAKRVDLSLQPIATWAPKSRVEATLRLHCALFACLQVIDPPFKFTVGI